MTDEVLVVAGAVLDGGRLLLAQRDRPAELAGLWELPGGKVEPGESPAQALVRELCEELDVSVSVGDSLAGVVRPKPGLTLVAMRATIVSGTVRAVEHRALRWVDADGLSELIQTGSMVPNDLAWARELMGELQVRRHGLS
ncbi:(deoxy)nucleoside triphosphate pyrophosphohydrolase [Gordonia neofelifaecis]|uniref:8-oxo-dGTP diphosphatase n=1 Tax=Gordonia neofelifaecis NRRL B-59395 TaxID=644548 RepID=F1YEN3_9ACTN|nr:(deoxy)nucleoside triphosphate pyrophosphohydrolase [Gordonia neofelifaecis]EGD56866.1 CTP pyrophosphohydrolase [Gordonia neofelifaecis NRRL B-59395]